MEEIQELKWETNEFEDFCVYMENLKRKLYYACGLPKEFFEVDKTKQIKL